MFFVVVESTQSEHICCTLILRIISSSWLICLSSHKTHQSLRVLDVTEKHRTVAIVDIPFETFSRERHV